MKQFLRSFLTLLMLVVWASGFAADFTADFTNGNIPSGWSKTGTTAKNDNYGTQLQKGASVTSPAFTEAIKTITINLTRSSNGTTFTIGYIKDGKTTTLKTFQKTDVKVNSLKNYNVDVPTEAQVSGVKFVFTSTKASYYIKTITFTSGVSKTATTLTFPKTAFSINGGDEASFKGQSAKLYAGKQELTDKTIEYAYKYTGDDIFATFDKTTGAATLKSGVFGTATVTATYEGDDTYEKAVATYTVKIVDPNASEVTFDFSKPSDFGCDIPETNNGTDIEEGKSIVSGIVSLTVKKNVNPKSRFWNSKGNITYRLYEGTINTVSVPEGYLITAIAVTTNGGDNFILGENADNSDWTGSAQAVDIKGTGKAVLTSMTVTYSKVAAATSLPLEEDADDTNAKIEKNNGKTVDVKLTRSLKAGLWNTICLPFNVTAEQVESVLKATGNVKEFDKEDKATATIFFKPATEMKAGVPYLIKPTEDAKVLNFKDVTINNVEEIDRINGNDYCICGVFGKYPMKTDGTKLFLNAAGKFVAPAAATNTMKGFRAYFMVPSGASAAAININIDGETTGINNIETNATVNGKVYNLNGQYVGNSLNGLKKGIYVVNGKKVIK